MIMMLGIVCLVSCVSCKTAESTISKETQMLFDSRPSMDIELDDYSDYAGWVLASAEDLGGMKIGIIHWDIPVSDMWTNWFATANKLEEVANYAIALEDYITVLDTKNDISRGISCLLIYTFSNIYPSVVFGSRRV